MKKHLLHFCVIILLQACNSDSETQSLRKENADLKNKLDSIFKVNSTYSYLPKVIAKENRIQLGEQYVADIVLVLSNSKSPYEVIIDSIYLNDKFLPFSSTSLTFNKVSECATFNFTPNSIGKYKYFGTLKSSAPLVKYPFSFEVPFEVVK